MRTLALMLGIWLAGGILGAAETKTDSKGQTNSPSTDELVVNQLDDKTKLNTGDIITFRVIEDKDPPAQRWITDTGEMEVPYVSVGRVPARGKTCKQFAAELKVLLEKDYYYKATVIISIDQIGGISQKQINVLGNVGRPGPVNIPPGLENQFTLSKAIAAAGAVNAFGNESKIQVTRKSASGVPEEQIIDLKKVIKEGQTDKDIIMKPGDIIFVPRRWVRFI